MTLGRVTKRQKIILVGGGVLLLAIGAIQGPKTLKALSGGSTAAAPASTTAAPPEGAAPAESTATPAPGSSALADGNKLASFERFARKDVFVPDAGPAPSTSSGAAKKGRSKTPSRSQVGYSVVLASIAAGDGRSAAAREARTAARRGLPKVHVSSSGTVGLRSGYYIVVSGGFEAASEAASALRRARRSGYPSAYTRRLAA